MDTRLLTTLALISVLTVMACGVAGAAQKVGPVRTTGEIDGAEFLIDIPKNWTGGLLMYAHGYVLEAQTPNFNEAMVRVGHELGYAVAQSKYSRQGWAAEQGVLETEALRQHFVATYGETKPTVIAGHSQGGAITYYTIEHFAEVYDGALSMCGSSEPTLRFFKERVFDMRLLFDYYFPGLPGDVVTFPEGSGTFVATMAAAQRLLKEQPDRVAEFIRLVDLPHVGAIPGVIAFWTEILRELQTRAGGNAFDNRDTIYSGTDNDAELNRTIKRYASDPKAVDYLREWVTIRGNISDPVISLHTLVDELIPVSSTTYYDLLTRLEGNSELSVQMYVNRSGHCNFTQEEMVEALQRLTKWIKKGRRPKPGDITGQEQALVE